MKSSLPGTGLSFQELKPILWGTVSNKDPQPVSRCRERVPQANQRCSVSLFAHCSIFFAPVQKGGVGGHVCRPRMPSRRDALLLLKRDSQGLVSITMRAVAVIALVSVCAPAHAFLGAGAGLTRQAPLARAERSAATKASAVRMQFKMPEMPAFSMPSFNGGAAGATAVGTVAVSGSRFVETMGSCAGC